jgi:hypothetical protein
VASLGDIDGDALADIAVGAPREDDGATNTGAIWLLDLATATSVLDDDGDGAPNSLDNCPDTANPGQLDADGDGTGDACDTCTDTDRDGFGNPGYPASSCALDNCPDTANPAQTDGEGDGAGDACDNCPATRNASQRDEDADGTGDACEVKSPVLYVSSDPDDDADYARVQDGVDAATEPGTRVEVFPGTGPYAESVTIDGGPSLTLASARGMAAIVESPGASPSILVTGTAPSPPVRLERLTVRGLTGVRAETDVELEGLTFEDVGTRGIDLIEGRHAVAAPRMDAGVAEGVRVGAQSNARIRQGDLRGLTGIAIIVEGTAHVDSTLIAEGADDGIRVAASGSLRLTHATLAEMSGAGVDSLAGGPAEIAYSILWNNAAGDLLGVDCADVRWSDVGSVDCTAVNDNRQTDPIFAADYRLDQLSPLLDDGPAPGTIDGAPCDDGAGDLRWRDADQDGIAQLDLGAFERRGELAGPPAVEDLRWSDDETLTWSAVAAAAIYHPYRDDASDLSFGFASTCRDDLDTDLSDTSLDDGESPGPGAAFRYLVTAEDDQGVEGPFEGGACVERGNPAPCP